jgi:putative addiction module killer protein
MEVKQTDDFAKWLRALTDTKARAKVLTRLSRLEDGNSGDAEPVGSGISEMRIHQGPGYRVYYAQHRGLYVALCGGDKSTQSKDIERAKTILSDLKAMKE